MFTDKQIARFWAKVDKTSSPHGCWLWTAAKRRDYGQVLVNGINYGAHRMSWMIENGPIPDGMEVCHNCPGGDNKSCVNTAHAYLGSRQQNAKDAAVKEQLKTKLTNAQVAEIKGLRGTGRMTIRGLAEMYGVTVGQIQRICYGTARQHVTAVNYLVEVSAGTQPRTWQLTDGQVELIRKRYQAGSVTQARLAREFDVDPAAIHRIIHGRSHKKAA